MKRSRIYWIGQALAVALVLAVLAAVFYYVFVKPIHEIDAKLAGIEGRTEAELHEKLGPPKYIVTASQIQRGREFPFRGYQPQPKHPVRNKVLVYMEQAAAWYVYIGPAGRVEKVVKVGT